MPTQRQPEVNPATPQTAGRSAAEFRPGVALAFIVGVVVSGSIGLFEHGRAWVCDAISIFVAGIALRRLRREQILLEGRATTIATVMHWEESECADGGRDYSVKYRFLGTDLGQETSQVELPREGEMLPVSYVRDEPARNLPLAKFWFYRFTYTGFAGWME
jgi:hypothetical protein